MTIKTSYFDGTQYSAADDVAPWASLLTDGIFSVSGGAFLVSANSPADLSVKVAAGACVKNGYYIKSDTVESVPIVANTSGYNRIDIIVAEVDTTNKVTTIKAVQGTPSSSPTAPLPTANQLKIAEVSVGNNVSVINTVNITDKRVNVDILGASLADLRNKAIIETGSNANGSCIKFGDGTLICEYTKTLDGTAITTAAGSLYRSTGIVSFTYPAAFYTTPYVAPPTFSGDSLIWAGSSAIGSANFDCYLVCPSSKTPGILTAKGIAIGRWKA